MRKLRQILDSLETAWRSDYVKEINVRVGDKIYRKVEIFIVGNKSKPAVVQYHQYVGDGWVNINPDRVELSDDTNIIIDGSKPSSVGRIMKQYLERRRRKIIEPKLELFSHFDDPERIYNLVLSKMDEYYLHSVEEYTIYLVRKSDYKRVSIYITPIREQIIKGLSKLLDSGKVNISEIGKGFMNIIIGYLYGKGRIQEKSVKQLRELGINTIEELIELISHIE